MSQPRTRVPADCLLMQVDAARSSRRRPLYSLPPVGERIGGEKILKHIVRCGDAPPNSFETFLKTKYFFCVGSGKTALWLGFRSLSRLRPARREIIVPAYACPDIVSAVLKAGLKPVLSDINPDDFGYSIKDLRRTIGSDTLAVVHAHFLGHPGNFNEVRDFCKENDIFIVEDAAQAFGNLSLDTPPNQLGTLGDIGIFSFGRGKPVSVLHGGILCTNSDEIYDSAKLFYQRLSKPPKTESLIHPCLLLGYDFFMSPYFFWIVQRMPMLHLGQTIFNPDFAIRGPMTYAFRLAADVASRLERDKGIRAANCEFYRQHFENGSMAANNPTPYFPYLRYPLVIKDPWSRDRILSKMAFFGTGAARLYPCPLNELDGLKEVLGDKKIYDGARLLSKCLITLPVHSGVAAGQRRRILDLLHS